MSTAIETPFVRLNQVLKAEDGEESNINQVLTSVAELDNYLKSIQEAPEPGMAALEATQARVGLKNADPIYTLKRISRGLPAPLDSLVNTLAQDSWYVVNKKPYSTSMFVGKRMCMTSLRRNLLIVIRLNLARRKSVFKKKTLKLSLLLAVRLMCFMSSN
ncbi:hypothetical protein [Vibrio parahaemolyticus]|uniref:hypothetical protein n=1 Tax=Vibrio parahaemolyticus TaxID=670 RepID=UPI00214B5662|nr:hypothetical protein [Vibrio parahaemolyticus]